MALDGNEKTTVVAAGIFTERLVRSVTALDSGATKVNVSVLLCPRKWSWVGRGDVHPGGWWVAG